MMFSNYENAQKIFDVGDQMAQLIVSRIHSTMISDDVRNDTAFSPRSEFDVAFFYQVVVDTFSKYLNREIHSGLNSHQKATGVSYPELSEKSWIGYKFVSSEMARHLVTTIQSRSQEDSTPFDVTFACRMCCVAFDGDFIEELSAGIHNDRQSYESWLEGFSQ